MTTTKILLNAFNKDNEPITLLLDRSVSFVFKESKNSKKSYFSVSGLDGIYSIDGEFTEMINEIEEQVSDIISQENSKISKDKK